MDAGDSLVQSDLFGGVLYMDPLTCTNYVLLQPFSSPKQSISQGNRKHQTTCVTWWALGKNTSCTCTMCTCEWHVYLALMWTIIGLLCCIKLQTESIYNNIFWTYLTKNVFALFCTYIYAYMQLCSHTKVHHTLNWIAMLITDSWFNVGFKVMLMQKTIPLSNLLFAN